MHNVAGHGGRSRNRGTESRAVVANCRKVLGHFWGVAGIDADAGKFADVEFEGAAVQRNILQGALRQHCLCGRCVFNQCGRGVLKNKPENAVRIKGILSGRWVT